VICAESVLGPRSPASFLVNARRGAGVQKKLAGRSFAEHVGRFAFQRYSRQDPSCSVSGPAHVIGTGVKRANSAIPLCRRRAPPSMACRPEDKLAALKERAQFSNIRYRFDREHRLDQSRRVAPQDRCEIARLFHYFGARHRVVWRAAHGSDALRNAVSVGEVDLDKQRTNDARRSRPHLASGFQGSRKAPIFTPVRESSGD
jgi:hypothetical protein